MQALDDCIKEIRNDSNISTWNEAQAKEWIIRPILDLLSWERREIIPEYGVETQSVDYALQINGENEVFIEAKRPRENLENHQKQILDYSFKEGVELAILTNGITWWFYLPLQKGPWNDRKFYTIDISEHEIEDIVDKFGLLLSRQNIASGEAVQHAESILQSHQIEKIVREDLPKAWNKVITNPDPLLVELLAKTVEKECSFKLESDEILRFIRSHHERWLLSSKLEQKDSKKHSLSYNDNQNGDNESKILRVLQSKICCDDCLSDHLAFNHRQQANGLALKLMKKGIIVREEDKCPICHKNKLLNRIADEHAAGSSP